MTAVPRNCETITAAVGEEVTVPNVIVDNQCGDQVKLAGPSDWPGHIPENQEPL